MRRALLALLCGCYGPHPQAGAPCNPDQPSCPSGQRCVSEAAGFFCETHEIIDALLADVAPADVAGPDAQTVFVYTATVAECIDPTSPNPDTCRSIKGNDQLTADGSDATTTHPWDAYVRFDLDAAIAGKAIQNVHFELTVTTASLAGAGSSGDVWQVTMFDKASLYITEPTKVGTLPIAPAQANVTNLQVVSFSIPTSLVAAGGQVYLGIITTSNDGVEYWNLDGATPPRLVVTVP